MQAGRTARRGKVAIIAMGAIVALALAWLAIRWLGGPPRLVQDDGRKTAEAFLTAVREGRVDEAWLGTSAEFKSLMGQEEFRKLAKATPEMRGPVEFASFETKAREGLSLADYRFHPAKGTGEVHVLLAPEGKAWKVEHVRIDRPAKP